MLRVERKQSRKLVLKILSWLFHTPRPMTMDEIREALFVRKGDRALYPEYLIRPEVLIECCESLVEFDISNDIVRFTHYTVQEFLKKNFDHLQISSVVDLAQTCLTYLNFEIFTQGDSGMGWSNWLWTHLFHSYAVVYWGHFTKGEGERDDEVRALLFDILNHGWKGRLATPTRRLLNSSLELVASEGLAMICRDLLEGVSVGAEKIDLAWSIRNSLFEAAKRGHKDVVEVLLDHGADPNPSAKRYGEETPLHLTAKYGHQDVSEVLIRRGASVSAGNYKGNTPLHRAATAGNKHVAQVLLRYYADPSAKGENGETPLHAATFQSDKDIVELLMRHHLRFYPPILIPILQGAEQGYGPLKLVHTKEQNELQIGTITNSGY